MPNQTPTRPLALERGPWGSAAWINDRCCRVRLKNPLGAMLVNTIIYRTPSSLVVIDPGWPWTLDALEQSLLDLGILTHGLGEVTDIVYTHTHIDHMGSAALLSWKLDATHHFLHDILPLTSHWHAYQDRLSDWDDWMLAQLVEPHRQHLRDMLATMPRRKPMLQRFGALSINPQRIRTFRLGEVVHLGEELDLEVHDASGHDPYHVAFLEQRDRILISGDALLAIPTPIMEIMGDDLARYEKTLARLPKLPMTSILPGHGNQVLGEEQVAAHIARSIQYVRHYDEAVTNHLAGLDSPTDLWSMGHALRPDDTITSHYMRWWAHLGQVQARLALMVQRGEVSRIVTDGPRYALT